MNTTQQRIAKAIELFGHTDFVVLGTASLELQGFWKGAADLDLFCRRPLPNGFMEICPSYREYQKKPGYEYGKVQVFHETHLPLETTTHNFFGQEILLQTASQVVQTKLLWNRPKDRLQLLELFNQCFLRLQK